MTKDRIFVRIASDEYKKVEYSLGKMIIWFVGTTWNMNGLMRQGFSVEGRDMEIKSIRTETDYEAALQEVERLWGAEPGNPDGDRFEVLFTLVEAYEEQHYPILPPDQ
jgi:hypothetical protein